MKDSWDTSAHYSLEDVDEHGGSETDAQGGSETDA